MPEAKLLHNKTRLQRWWDLSRLLTNIFVNFGNFFNSIILSPFLLRKKYLQKTEEWAIPVWLEDNDKNLGGWGWGGGGGRVLPEGMSKNEQIQFFDSQIYLQ